MRSRIRYLFALGCLAVVVGACDQPVAPDADQVPSVAAAGSGLLAWSNTIDAVHLNWPDNSQSETGYEVHRSVTGASGVFTLRATLAVNATDHTDTELEPKTEYCYKVRSFKTTRGKINHFAFTNTACVTTWGEPPAPTWIFARPFSVSTVGLSWGDNSMVETGYRLERSASAEGPWTEVATLPANQGGYIDGSLTVEEPLCYRVIAFNTVGESPPSLVKCTALPARPTDLTAIAVDHQSVDLTWADKSAFEDGYEVHRSLGNDWSLVATLPANAISHRDAGLTTNTRYSYRVRALRDGGNTDFSTAASALVVGAPPPPPSSTAAWATGPAVVVYWTGSGPTAEGYRVERSDDGVSGWTAIATVAAGASGASDADRPLEQRVCYRVIAFNRLGDSPPSGTSCLTPLATPTDFAAAPAGDGAIDLTWTDVSQANTEYYLEILRTWYGGLYGYYEWWEHLTTVGNVESYRVIGLDPTQFHRFRVTARSGSASSLTSPEAGSWTEAPPTPPSNLWATAISVGQIDLTWNDNSSGESQFDIERCEGTADACDDGWFVVIASLASNTTRHSDVYVAAGTTYTYRVRAYRGAPFSDPSNEATATTPSAPEE